MKRHELSLLPGLALALSLGSCSSVAIPTRPVLPQEKAGQRAIVPVTTVDFLGWLPRAGITGDTLQQDGRGVIRDTETGASLVETLTLRGTQGRSAGAIEIPPPSTSISHAPQSWDLTLLAGYRNMSSGAWNELQNQGVIGIETAFYTSPTSQVGIEVGIQGSYSRDGERSASGQHFNLDGNVGEIYAGGRSRGRIGTTPIRWGVGFGLGLIRAQREDIINNGVQRGSDVSITFYGHLLTAVDLSAGVYIGFDLRANFGSTMSINGNAGSANYLQGAFALGFDL